MDFVNPSLLISFLRGQRVYFRRDAHYSGDVSGLRLCARHSAEPGCHEEHSLHVVPCRRDAPFAQLHPGCVHHRDCSAVHYSLRAYVHVGSGCHLPVLRHSEGIHPLPVILFGIVRDDHAVGDDHPRGIPVAREKSERMARVHHEGLRVGHFRQVAHCQPVLCPVLEDGPVAPVSYELVRMLCHTRVQIVLYHGHDGRGLAAFGGIHVNRAGIHLIVRTESVHVDSAVCLELAGEFLRKDCMVLPGKISQRIPDGEDFLFFREDVLAHRGMVYLIVVWLRFREDVRNAFCDRFPEFFCIHVGLFYFPVDYIQYFLFKSCRFLRKSRCLVRKPARFCLV